MHTSTCSAVPFCLGDAHPPPLPAAILCSDRLLESWVFSPLSHWCPSEAELCFFCFAQACRSISRPLRGSGSSLRPQIFPSH